MPAAQRGWPGPRPVAPGAVFKPTGFLPLKETFSRHGTWVPFPSGVSF